MMTAFIGAGKVGTALGIYFREKGIPISGYYSRTPESARQAAEVTGSRFFSNIEELLRASDTIWITTNDDAIGEVARVISELEFEGEKIFLHAGGALTSSVLSALQEKGYPVCSAHPLLAFNDARQAAKMLNETYFFVEGDENARQKVTEYLNKAGNHTVIINKEQKVAYHAGAVMLSNYLVTLSHAANSVFGLADIPEKDILPATLVLLKSTLDNMEGKAPKDALTGPIRRGDAETVKKHLTVLNKELPEVALLYKALGRETMNMTGDYRLKNILDDE